MSEGKHSMWMQVKKGDLNKYAGYILSTPEGEAIKIGVRPFKKLLHFTPDEIDDNLFLHVIMTDEDEVKLHNRFVKYCFDHRMFDLGTELTEQMKTKLNNRRIRPVQCLETGETFESVRKCAIERKIGYQQLLNQVNGVPGFKSVKGRVYVYVD